MEHTTVARSRSCAHARRLSAWDTERMAVVAGVVVLGGLATLALVIWRSVVAARPGSGKPQDPDHL